MAGRWQDIDAYLESRGIRIGAPTIGQTTGGVHANGSRHYLGRARDYGVGDSDGPAVYAALVPFATGPNYQLEELFFGSAGFDNGQPWVEPNHEDHVHAALKSGGVLSDQGLNPAEYQAFLNQGPKLADVPVIGGVLDGAKNTISDVGSAAVSVAKNLASFAGFLRERGRFLLLVPAGIFLIVVGVIWLNKDLIMAAKGAG